VSAAVVGDHESMSGRRGMAAILLAKPVSLAVPEWTLPVTPFYMINDGIIGSSAT